MRTLRRGRLRGGSQPPGARGALRGPPGVPAGRRHLRCGARQAAPDLDPGSARVADELTRLAQEPTAPSALALLGSLGVPWLSRPRDAGLRERFTALDEALARPGAPEIPVWPLRLGEALDPDTLAGTAVPGWARALGAEARAGAALAERLDAGAAPSEVDRLLRAAPPATAVGALSHGAEAVAGWWAHGRDREPAVRGADLVSAGIAPGAGDRAGARRRCARRSSTAAWAGRMSSSPWRCASPGRGGERAGADRGRHRGAGPRGLHHPPRGRQRAALRPAQPGLRPQRRRRGRPRQPAAGVRGPRARPARRQPGAPGARRARAHPRGAVGAGAVHRGAPRVARG